MTERSRFIKVRLRDDEYQDLRRRADEHGITMSEHVRAVVATVHESQDVARSLAEMKEALSRLSLASAPERPPASDSQGLELLLIVRELAAARDAQILTRVRAQVAARAPGSRLQGEQR